MKIRMTLTLPFDNELQFYDVCKGAIDKLNELAQHAITEGEYDTLRGAHDVVAANDDAEVVGQIIVEQIKVRRSK